MDIAYGTLTDLIKRIDRNRNNRIDAYEGRVVGAVGNDNGIAGTRETADAIVAGRAQIRDFTLDQPDADEVARGLANGDAWVSKDDLHISDRARARIDGLAGGAADNRISAKELAAALSRGGLALARDGLYLSDEASGYRPEPPPVNRPEPPPVNRPEPPPVNRPAPPPVNRPEPPPVDRPEPPEVREPRYYWQPTYPIILPTERREIPRIPLPPRPEGARKVDPGEVSADPFELLAASGRLRTRRMFLWFIPYHPKIGAGEARAALQAGQQVYVGSGGFWGSKRPITEAGQLDSYVAEERARKLADLQQAENRAAESRLSAWRESDIQNRQSQLPPFNSVYDMVRLNLNNLIVSECPAQFNRNLITALNIFNQPATRREIARKWHENPDMTTSEFNRMANSVETRKVSELYWDARHQGDWGTYLGTNPVPGLRYPDTQEDVDYNAAVIRRVAVELPLLLNSAVLD
ncbi:MAG: hypothetical protein FJZ01_02230 [Candidatus Sericytochromatia bacterium]|nr:hypothetical protein [Candidatus Tanganyikabacteria bacterium]